MANELLICARLAVRDLREIVDDLECAVIAEEYDIEPWHFPVGTVEHPPEDWYVASVHDLTGVKNDGYRHSGVDLNLQVPPRGDVDLGQPVFAVADGEVYGTWHSERNLASVVIEVIHNGKLLWVRYWHLANDDAFRNLRPGKSVLAGQTLGHLGDYPPGPRRGAHLHFDMALEPFHPGCWLVSGVTWVDPVPILKSHLDVWLVEKMLVG